MTSRYLTFKELPSSGKTAIYLVNSTSHGFTLGRISWFGRWRQYTFFPEPETVFNRECLNDISAFIRDLMAVRRTR